MKTKLYKPIDDPSKITVGQLLHSLSIIQVWGFIVFLFGLASGGVYLGYQGSSWKLEDQLDDQKREITKLQELLEKSTKETEIRDEEQKAQIAILVNFHNYEQAKGKSNVPDEEKALKSAIDYWFNKKRINVQRGVGERGTIEFHSGGGSLSVPNDVLPEEME